MDKISAQMLKRGHFSNKIIHFLRFSRWALSGRRAMTIAEMRCSPNAYLKRKTTKHLNIHIYNKLIFYIKFQRNAIELRECRVALSKGQSQATRSLLWSRFLAGSGRASAFCATLPASDTPLVFRV